MNIISSINDLLTFFQPLFNSQGYVLFCGFIMGILCQPKRKTITGIYLASPSKKKYWSMVKFLSRGKWNPDDLAKTLTTDSKTL